MDYFKQRRSRAELIISPRYILSLAELLFCERGFVASRIELY